MNNKSNFKNVDNYIFVENFQTKCLIGIYPKEKSKKQNLRISVILKIKRKYKQDSLKSVISYEKIIDELEKVKNLKHLNLVETLAQHLANKFLLINDVKLIEIKIEKIDILKGNGSTGAKLVYSK